MAVLDRADLGRGNGHAPGHAFERMGRFLRSPQIALPRPGKPPATVVIDRVRARPAVTPTLAGSLGVMGVGLGLVELFAARHLARWLGMSERSTGLIRAFGVREIATSFALMADPTRTRWLWARTAGDVLDYAALRAADRADNPHAHRVRGVIGFILFAGVLDAVVAGRMSTVKRTCGGEARR
ncbi:hypothetical protein [Caulobacter sp. 17J80-11]|uniref:hypothetical protein n=1 Tax=Caulobacter sp. 17J80-11 TaxID=2763502 RepID=UPI0016535766|nr:hypothetical protein [Caulobacter sp. 17J80-11]MBC6982070.1 hypothetical protein [Caulobacter sp. 17J80-11]